MLLSRKGHAEFYIPLKFVRIKASFITEFPTSQLCTEKGVILISNSSPELPYSQLVRSSLVRIRFFLSSSLLAWIDSFILRNIKIATIQNLTSAVKLFQSIIRVTCYFKSNQSVLRNTMIEPAKPVAEGEWTTFEAGLFVGAGWRAPLKRSNEIGFSISEALRCLILRWDVHH